MDLRAMSGSYRGSGSASYHPRMLLGILVLWLCDGDIFRAGSWSGRLMTRWRFVLSRLTIIPDHDTIATFRQRFLKQIEGLFVQVLLLAREMGMLKAGHFGDRRHEDPR